MAPQVYPVTLLDANQVIQYVYDEATQTLRTTATAVIIGGDITVEIDGVYAPGTNPDPDNIGLIAHNRATTPIDSDQTNRITSITNLTVHALDVSLHNSDGTAIDGTNPLSITGTVTTDPDVNIHDGAGNSLTSQINGGQRALDVGINVAGVQIDPRGIRDLDHTQDSVRLGDGTSLITSTLIGLKQALDVNVANSITATVGVADKTIYIYGTSLFQAIGGVYQDTSPSLAAGESGSVRLTENRAFHINLRNDSGTEIGTVANPVQVNVEDIDGDYSATATLTQVPRTNASTTLKAANAARKGLILFNDSAAVCYVSFAGTSSSTAFTFRMTNNETVSLNKDPIYTGIITGIWASNGAGAMMVTELT